MERAEQSGLRVYVTVAHSMLNEEKKKVYLSEKGFGSVEG